MTQDAIITLGLGDYRLRERIAGSVYGVIWRAAGPRGTTDVALKLINEEQMRRALPAQRERWIASATNEISFLHGLEPWDERHIVRLLDSGWHNGLPVLALELLDGDLARHVAGMRAKNDTLPFARALDWIAQLNQALAKVHQYGWRYLDLKPANVLVDARMGTVKLADFGTSRLLEAPPLHSYAGTANWQAPEQFFPAPSGAYTTAAHSDYFSLGALFYYLATSGGHLRFCSDCGHAYREYHTAGAAELLRRHDGSVPPTLHAGEEARFAQAAGAAAEPALALLRRLLHADPTQRPRHAIAISRDLAAIGSAHRDSAAHPASPASPLSRVRASRQSGAAAQVLQACSEQFGRPAAGNNWGLLLHPEA